jgi:hypothetical protein
MEAEPKSPREPREPKGIMRLWVQIRVILWAVMALGSVGLSAIFSRSEPYNPYFAEEGNSENIPSLRH